MIEATSHEMKLSFPRFMFREASENVKLSEVVNPDGSTAIIRMDTFSDTRNVLKRVIFDIFLVSTTS